MERILKIKELGDPVLRKVTKSVSAKEFKSKKFQSFLDDLVFTCKKSGGVGIAANQVGVSKSVFVIWSRPSKKRPKAPKMKPLVIVNPKILSSSKQTKKDWEGCLSIPGIRGKVERSKGLEVEFLDRGGQKISQKFSSTKDSFIARIFQHEFDHLNGVVFLDRADPKYLITEREYKRKFRMKN